MEKFDPFARRPTRSMGLFVTTEPSPKNDLKSPKEFENILSPLESPGKVLQKQHDFDIDLNMKIDQPKPQSFLEPSIPLNLSKKSLSLSEYKKKKGVF